MRTYFARFVYVFTVKGGQEVGGRVCVWGGGERVTFDKTITIAKEARLSVS